MKEHSFIEKIIYFFYGLLVDYFLGMGAYLYVRFTLDIVNQKSLITGLFWSFFIMIFLDKALKNKMIERECYGRNSIIISRIARGMIIIFFALTVGF